MFTSCRHINVREKTITLPKHQWQRSYNAFIDLDVADSGQHFIYFVVRHSEKFGYTHLPVRITIQDTAKNSGPFVKMRLNAPLVRADDGWAGSNMDDLYYRRIRITTPVLLKQGRYRFTLQHEMKEDPLPNILDVGVAIDKIQPH